MTSHGSSHTSGIESDSKQRTEGEEDDEGELSTRQSKKLYQAHYAVHKIDDTDNIRRELVDIFIILFTMEATQPRVSFDCFNHHFCDGA